MISQPYLWYQDLVSRRNARCDSLPLLVQTSWPDGQHLCFVELLDAAFGQENTACSLGFGFDSLDEYAIEEGREGLDGFECCRLCSWLVEALYGCNGRILTILWEVVGRLEWESMV